MLSSFIARARSLWRARHRSAFEREMHEEFEHHIVMRAADLVRAGLAPAEAMRRARVEFGGTEHFKEEARASRGLRALDELRFSWLDVKLGARMLVKHPGLTIVGGLGMAVAIAVGAGSFAFFYSHIFPKLPLEEGDRIVSVENWDVARNNESRRAMYDFVAWRGELKTIRELGAFRTVGRNLIVPGGSSEPVRIAEMTASGFRVARVDPLLGRPLLEEDERAGAPNVLVIGHDAWRTRFGADPRILGREVRLGSTVHTIVGVMPAGFTFPVDHIYWRPLRVDAFRAEPGEGPSIMIFGRLAPRVTMAQAQGELAIVGQRASTAHPTTHANLRPRVHPYTHPIIDIQGINGWQLAVFQTTVSLLLLIVAVNVAVLVYARTATRAGEIAVRTALGASRRRIIAQLAGEVLVLTAGAAIVGLALAQVGMRLGNAIMLTEMGGRMPFWMDLTLSWETVVYVLGLAVVTVLIVGVLPALQATGKQLQASLRQLGGGTGIRLGRTWTTLIVAQVAVAVAGLPIAVAAGWGEIGTVVTTPTFDSEQFLAAGVLIDEELTPDDNALATDEARDARYAAVHRELVWRLTMEPGVAGVTFADAIPGDDIYATVEVEGMSAAAAPGSDRVTFSRVDPKLHEMFGARLVAGRYLAASDVGDAGHPVVVNRTFASRVLNDGDAVGRRFRYARVPAWEDVAGMDTTRWFEIVGVVEDLFVNRFAPDRASASVYHPGELDAASFLLIRASPGAHAGISAKLREITTAIDPDVRLAMVRSYRDFEEQQRLVIRLVAIILGLIALTVLLLSAAGIYALMSVTVSRRQREIGVRVALGALPRQIVTAIFSRAIRQLALGILVGVAAALALDASTGGELLEGKGLLLLPPVALLIIVVGTVAALGPARRGLRIEPTEALRGDG